MPAPKYSLRSISLTTTERVRSSTGIVGKPQSGQVFNLIADSVAPSGYPHAQILIVQISITIS